MGQHDDITDAFDDDDLKSSIEAADKRGMWRDEGATFDDPKVRELARKLAQAPRETYTERRLQELQRRIAAKESATAPQKTALFQDQVAPLEQVFANTPSVDDWREPPMAEPAPAPAAVAPVAQAPREESPFSVVLACLRCIAAAIVVFAVAAVVQGLLNGYTVNLGVRAAAAAGTAGIAWYLANAGRFRSAAIGIGVHMLAFLGDTQAANQARVMAVLLGMIIVLIGSGAAGIMNEERSARGK